MGSYFLYAEDDTDDIALFKEAIEDNSKADNTVYVSNGFDLLTYLQKVKISEAYPCLIILDFHLPRVNGMETLSLLKTDDLYRLIPVIILSSKLSEADEEKCKSLGADVILKPVEFKNWQKIASRFQSYLED
jgi:CheY-like chemotaxis protein